MSAVQGAPVTQRGSVAALTRECGARMLRFKQAANSCTVLQDTTSPSAPFLSRLGGDVTTTKAERTARIYTLLRQASIPSSGAPFFTTTDRF